MIQHLMVIFQFIPLVLALESRAQEAETLRKQFLGESPPELVSQNEHWLGKSEPVTLVSLKGRVIWLQFNF